MDTPMTVFKQGNHVELHLFGYPDPQSNTQINLQIEAGKTAAWAGEISLLPMKMLTWMTTILFPKQFETFGNLGHRCIGHKFIPDNGRTISKKPKSTTFIFQAISMTVPCDNVKCVQGAYCEFVFEELDKSFYIINQIVSFKILTFQHF